MKRRCRVAMLVAGLLAISILGAAQQEVPTMEDRLIVFTHQVRMGLTLATVAALSPTLGDLRLHAQQLVNLLEGTKGRHFVQTAVALDLPLGLRSELSVMRDRLSQASQPGEARRLVLTATANVGAFLELALSATLEGLEQRRLDGASGAMLRAYAFLLAAYENPCGTTYVPALWAILRAFDLTERLQPSTDG